MGHYLCTSQWPKSPSSVHIMVCDLIPLAFLSFPPQPPYTSAPPPSLLPQPAAATLLLLLFPFFPSRHTPLPPLPGLTLLPHHNIFTGQQSRSCKGRRRQNQVLNRMLAHLPGGRCSEEHAEAEASYNVGNSTRQPYTSCLRRGGRLAVSGHSDA